jgi:hypothetical protein
LSETTQAIFHILFGELGRNILRRFAFLQSVLNLEEIFRRLNVNAFPLKKALFIPLAFLLLVACDDKPVFPNEPEITFVSITPTVATQFTADEIALTFHYQDGDGDLGYDGDPVNNLFIIDTRAAFANNPGRITAFSFESLTPDTRKPSIQGEISVVLTTPPYEVSEEPLVFDVYITDRAGNVSNVIQTSPITITQ